MIYHLFGYLEGKTIAEVHYTEISIVLLGDYA